MQYLNNRVIRVQKPKADRKSKISYVLGVQNQPTVGTNVTFTV